jgi:hypothetical protein
MRLFIAASLLFAALRTPDKGCRWETFSDPTLGLEASVQRCELRGRTIDFLTQGRSLAIRYSDGGKPEPVIDVFDLRDGESPEAGVRRIWAEHTPKKVVAQCVMKPYDGPQAPGRQRWTFVPRVPPKTANGDIPDPQCGDYGDDADTVQYWETQPGARRVLFVRAGQDEPLFDENTLRILPRR